MSTTGAALRAFRADADRLEAIAADLKVAPADAGERVRKLMAQAKALEKDLQDAKRRAGKDLVGDIMGRAAEAGGVRIVSAEVEAMDPAALRELADAVKGKLKSGLLLLGSRDGGRVHLVAGVTADLTASYSASDIVKKAAGLVGGGGGGRRDMAQAGGTKADGLPEALASLAGWVPPKT